MSRLNKILILVFVLLVGIIIAELGYYFYADKPQLQACTTIKRPGESVLNEVLIESLKKMLSYSFVSSVVSNTYQGNITELNEKTGTLKPNQASFKNANMESFSYNIILKIKREGEADSLDFYFNNKTLNKIVEKNNGQENLINIKDLKIGDNVTIIQKVDLTQKSDCFKSGCASYEIIKLY